MNDTIPEFVLCVMAVMDTERARDKGFKMVKSEEKVGTRRPSYQ